MDIKTNAEQFNKLKESGELIIVDFFATWCGPCKMFIPIFSEVASNNSNLKMLMIDIDEETETASLAGVQSVPTIIAYKNGIEISRFSGFKSKEELELFINGLK